MSGHLDGPPPGPPDPPYIPGDLGAPSAKEFARRRAGDRHMSDTTRMEWRVVEATGDPYPPHASPMSRRGAAERRRDYYSSPGLKCGGEARPPKLPLRIEWRAVVITEWNTARGLDLVEPKE